MDVATGREVWREPLRLTSNIAPAYAFTPDGRTVIESWFDPVLRRFEVATGRQLLLPGEPREDPVYDMVFSPDGRSVYSVGFDTYLHAWDAATGKRLSRRDVQEMAGALSPDGASLAKADKDSVALIDTATGTERWRCRLEAPEYPRGFSADSKLLLSRQAGTLILRDAADGREVRRLAAQSRSLGGAVCSPDNRHLFVYEQSPPVTPADSRIRIWDYRTGRERRSISLRTWSVAGVAVSPDGKTMAAHRDDVIELWETETGRKRLTIGKTESWPYRFAFAPEGDLLLASNPHGIVRLYDVFTGRCLLRLENASGQPRCFAFSPDGRRLATGNADLTGLIWDWPALRGRCERPPAGEPHGLHQLWAELADADAAKAYRALGTLYAMPERSVPFLRAMLRPAPVADASRIDQWLAELDGKDFATRQHAAAELQRAGDAAEPALRRALEGKPSVELRRRVEQRLARLEWDATPERMRLFRAVEVLEHVATAEARQLLQALATGRKDAGLTREASASLKRLARWPVAR